jgi:nonsense-mediated mRNA decay protein 3
MILCCLCGVSITPNDAAMCMQCLAGEIDTTEDIPASQEIIQCGKCDKYMVGMNNWVNHAPESASLLAFCLRKALKSNTKVENSSFIWTEPHSKRIKISVTVNREVLDKIAINQTKIVEFVIRTKQCNRCISEASEHSWQSRIQLRQRVDHNKTFYAIEEALVKAKLFKVISDIDLSPKDGLDFYFVLRKHADLVVEQIKNSFPCRVKTSKKTVSHDSHSGVQRNEYSILVEIAPYCRGDLVFVPTGRKKKKLMLVTKVSSSLHLIDPSTLESEEQNYVKLFSRDRPVKVLSSSNLSRFVVMDIEPHDRKKDFTKGQYSLGDAVLARECDLGSNDDTFPVTTHLAHRLQPGDVALGYDIKHAVVRH